MLKEPECSKRKCKYFLGVLTNGDETIERVICSAFPVSIPSDIAYGGYKHESVREGQEGEYVYSAE